MYSNSEIKFYWFAAIFGCGLMLITLGTASAQQPLRPALILDVGAPQEVKPLDVPDRGAAIGDQV